MATPVDTKQIAAERETELKAFEGNFPAFPNQFEVALMNFIRRDSERFELLLSERKDMLSRLAAWHELHRKGTHCGCPYCTEYRELTTVGDTNG